MESIGLLRIYIMSWTAQYIYQTSNFFVCLTIILSLMVNIIWKKGKINLFFYCKADKCLMAWNNIFINRLRSVFQALLEVFPLFGLWFSYTKIPEPIYILANIYLRHRFFGGNENVCVLTPEWILVATFK